MNAKEMTFGVEIECYIPARVMTQNGFRVGPYHNGIQVPGLPNGWNLQRDGSVSDSTDRPVGFEGVELVSGVLRGDDGIGQIIFVAEMLANWGAIVKKSCGLHIHIGFPAHADQIGNVLTVFANHEKALFASTGTKNRETNHYCASIRPVGSAIDLATPDIHRLDTRRVLGKYSSLNVGRVVHEGLQTVEFRLFAGTTNGKKIIAHVRQALAICEKSQKIKRRPNWTAKETSLSSPINRGGVGCTELCRFFYSMGWTKGRTDYVYGLVGEELSPMSESKAVLERLAKKYDGRENSGAEEN